MFRIGYSLARGKGIPIDIEGGYKHLISAAKEGHIFALREISLLDIKGHRGNIRRVTGILMILFSIFLGVIISFKDRYSDRLRA